MKTQYLISDSEILDIKNVTCHQVTSCGIAGFQQSTETKRLWKHDDGFTPGNRKIQRRNHGKYNSLYYSCCNLLNGLRVEIHEMAFLNQLK